MKNSKLFLFAVCFLGKINFIVAQQSFNIIPQPYYLNKETGYVEIEPQSEIAIVNKEAPRTVEYLNNYLYKWLGYKLKVVNEEVRNPKITRIVYDIKIKRDAPDEAYGITAEGNTIRIYGDGKGVFYATQTMLQLMEQNMSQDKKKINFPTCVIYDYPRFSYRGLHLDVGRHFFNVDFIKRYLDLMSYYKFNTFHWHLTEDQGWRIEIKKYPALMRVGSMRKETIVDKKFEPYQGDGKPYGGYYTQDQIREIVKYAATRNITIVPEIEMPGHALAALAAYPYLGCTKGPYEVGTRWGVYDDVFCAGNDSTFKFLQDVLDEVIQLFPGKYIHIGGDECPKTKWHNCPKCQQRIQELHLRNEEGLQSYFISRIEKYLNSKGKQIIGWDEILEGGLAENASVMSWRGEEGGIAAAKNHHDVIMTPSKYVYFDYYQSHNANEPLAIGGYLPVSRVYSYDPIPAALSPEEVKYIKGAQANVWTEYIPTASQLEYMVFPRAIALSEVLWTQRDKKNYDNFLSRLKVEMKRLDRLKVNYAQHVLEITGTVSRDFQGFIKLDLRSRMDGAKIYYTFDGSTPDTSSELYSKPLFIKLPLTIRANAFIGGRAFGNEYVQSFAIHKACGKKVVSMTQPNKEYNPGNDFALVDGIEGNENFNDNNWFGYNGKDFDAIVDLDQPTDISAFGINFINAPDSWIYPPVKVIFSISNDGQVFSEVASTDSFTNGKIIKVKLDVKNVKARYVRVEAGNFGKIPQGKQGEGHTPWLFVDEFEVW